MLACEKLEQVVQFINEEKRHVENLSAILQIQNKLSGLDFHLLQPGRTLIKESVLTQLIDGKEKNRLFCLFNDILVIAKVYITSRVKLINTRKKENNFSSLTVRNGMLPLV